MAQPEDAPAFAAVEALRYARFDDEAYTRQTLFAGEASVTDLFCMQARQGVEFHTHPATEHTILVLEGTAQISVGDVTHTLGPGMLTLIPAATYHALRNLSDHPVVLLQISTPKPYDGRFAGPRPVQPTPDLPPRP